MNRPLLRPKLFSGFAFAFMVTIARAGTAEPPPPVDVVIREAPPPQRYLTIQWNPFALFVDKVSADIVVTPVDHHGLVLSPFYAWPSTVHISITDPNSMVPIDIPSQTFTGFGGEIGYRYYTGKAGARGFFAGPSFVIASMTAAASDSSKTSFQDYGLALDVGYGALVADRIAITLGGGAQYIATSKSIPDQQFPATIYANTGLRPRLLLGLGYGF
jgi:hypothetical protein